MEFLARISVTLKPIVNDPQGETILGGLRTLGYDSLGSLRAGKLFEVTLASDTQEAAEATVREICHRVLANPVMEEFGYSVTPLSGAATSDVEPAD